MRGLIGVIHLLPLPGDPGHRGGGFAVAYERARADAEALVRGGVDGLIVENFGSAPFVKGTGHERIPASKRPRWPTSPCLQAAMSRSGSTARATTA
jgi:predicted TIM-barrel enzyme